MLSMLSESHRATRQHELLRVVVKLQTFDSKSPNVSRGGTTLLGPRGSM